MAIDAIDLNVNLNRIRSLLVRDHGLIAVSDLRLVDIEGPFGWGKGIEIVRDDGSIMFLSIDSIGGVSTRDRIYTASELESQAEARRVREEARFTFLHFASSAEWEAIAQQQRYCAAGAASTCGPEEVRVMPVSHVRDGRIYCGADSGLAIRYGSEFDATWTD